MRLEVEMLKTIDEVCAAFEEEGLNEEYASETIRVVRALTHGKKAIIESGGALEVALKKRFAADHHIWSRLSSEDSECYLKAADPIEPLDKR